ncbi:MAG: PD40 domain-containing protein [Actinobacteria bacterium]|nr:PD40 domain-containing protein [Actinomycetota bacterium]
MRSKSRLVLIAAVLQTALLIAVFLLSVDTATAGYPGMIRVSTNSSGAEAHGDLSFASADYRSSAISGSGRYVAFESRATDLVSGDTDELSDIFVKDAETGATTMVSTDSAGAAVYSESIRPSISTDGRFVTFTSDSPDLVAGDTNGVSDVFLKDTQTGVTTRISTDSSGVQANSYGFYSAISGDGRYVAFESDADNLVADDTNQATDIFVKDTLTSVTARVSTDSSGNQATRTDTPWFGNSINMAPTISHDGRYVAFQSFAENLAAGDANGCWDIFIKDTVTGGTTIVSTDTAGFQSNFHSYYPSISADGRYLAFESWSNNLVAGDTNYSSDIFQKDILTGVTMRVSTSSSGDQGAYNTPFLGGGSFTPTISADGRYVTFISEAANLAPGDVNRERDIFVKDTVTGATALVSSDAVGRNGIGYSYGPAISADGRYISFLSEDYLLVPDDTNAARDYYRARNSLATNLYFPWYDNLYGRTWLMMANPAGSRTSSYYNFLEGDALDANISVASGSTAFRRYDGQMGGPAQSFATKFQPLVSERSLYGSSFEEVWATPYKELDSHYYWPNYLGSSMDMWVLAANPEENGEAIQVDLTILTEGSPGTPVTQQQVIQPGDSWTPIVPGLAGYSVEVEAYRVGGAPDNPADARKVIASERSLMAGAFNEMPGIPASRLSDHWLWPWYDSLNSLDFICVGNPGSQPVWVSVYVGGVLRGTPHQLAAGQVQNWGSYLERYADGPVEVYGCANGSVPCDTPADIYASQAVVFGPSYQETSGIRYEDLLPTAHWTWYDMSTPGSADWVLVSNPNDYEIYYEISMPGLDTAGDIRAHGILGPGDTVTPTFPGFIGGPVQVSAWRDSQKNVTASIYSSQRVLWNGYFNELTGLGF